MIKRANITQLSGGYLSKAFPLEYRLDTCNSLDKIFQNQLFINLIILVNSPNTSICGLLDETN